MTDEERHNKISAKILDALQECVTEGLFANPQMLVSSFVTAVEFTTGEGKSQISVLYSDERLTIILGLLNYAHMWCGAMFSPRGDNG